MSTSSSSVRIRRFIRPRGAQTAGCRTAVSYACFRPKADFSRAQQQCDEPTHDYRLISAFHPLQTLRLCRTLGRMDEPA